MTVQHSNYFHTWIVILILSDVLLLLAGGCAATTKPPTVVEVDPRGIWPAQPLASLTKEVPTLYLPAHPLDGITLTSVLWRPQRGAIPTSLKLSNEALNDNRWYVAMIFGSSSNELWIYQGEGLADIENLASKVEDFAPSGEQLKLAIDPGEPQTVSILSSAEGDASAISFAVDRTDLLVIWQRITVSEIATFVNSLTPASQSEELVTLLEREWQ